MSEADIKDSNLLVVIAVDGYAMEHGITSDAAFARLNELGVVKAIRDNYAALHTQDPMDVVGFVNDVVARGESASV